MWDKIRDAGQFLLAGFDLGGRFPLAVNDRRTIYASRYCPAGHFPRGTKSASTPEYRPARLEILARNMGFSRILARNMGLA